CHAEVAEATPGQVVEEVAGNHVVADVEVLPAVVIVVLEHRSPAAAVLGEHAGFARHVLEPGATWGRAEVAVEPPDLWLVKFRPADHRFRAAMAVARALRAVARIGGEVHVQVAVVVNIAPGRALAPLWEPDSGLASNV